jgi:heptosyltransferase-3
VVPDPDRQKILLTRIGDDPPVAVHISARRPAQQWPLERYAELILELQKTTRVMLLWAPGSKDDPRHPGDDERARQLMAETKALAVATPDLRSLIAALSLARTLICPDGGAMHLAAGLGKPVVALFGDSPVERWRPWGVPHRLVRPDSGDLRDLPVAPVVNAYFDLAASISR